MKVHQFARGPWDHEPSLTLGCSKRLRPLAPKLATPNHHDATAVTTAAFDLKSFIRPESGPRKLGSFDDRRPDSTQVVETHPGGTRWNPTQEQIGILEMLYRGGMRTPSTPQIDEITKQLGKYGKIEGKNVFYWFQNHKARERQKQKRSSLSLGHSPRTPSPPLNPTPNIHLEIMQQQGEQRVEREEDSPYKRKCRSWGFESSENNSRSCVEAEEEEGEEDLGDKTLELFPLHPECGPWR